MLTDRTNLFLLGIIALLPLLGLAVLLWRRYYREDTGNTARRVVKNSVVPLALRLVVRAADGRWCQLNPQPPDELAMTRVDPGATTHSGSRTEGPTDSILDAMAQWIAAGGGPA